MSSLVIFDHHGIRAWWHKEAAYTLEEEGQETRYFKTRNGVMAAAARRLDFSRAKNFAARVRVVLVAHAARDRRPTVAHANERLIETFDAMVEKFLDTPDAA